MTKCKGAKHPIQPLEKDNRGTIRFKKNNIVRFLLDNGPHDLNKIAMMEFNQEDCVQFAQLIGYSHSGAGDLFYFDDETWEAAMFMYRGGFTEKDARIQYLEEKVGELRDRLKIPVKMCAEMLGVNEEDILELMKRPGE